MLDINKIDKQAFLDVWNEIVSIMESMESDKTALKNLKNELGSVIGADNSKETNALVKALLKKQKDGEFYDNDSISVAEEIYDEFIGGY